MLVDPESLRTDKITEILHPGRAGALRIEAGVYRIEHFSFDSMLSPHGGNLALDGSDGWDSRTDSAYKLDERLSSSGICDSIQQFFEDGGQKLKDAETQFCISFTRLRKDEQYESGGWRWHKWGEYMGRQEPTCEYLYDEPLIEEVYIYHVFEKT